MSNIQIITDSASDISAADEAALSIEILPFQVTLGGQSYLSRVDFDNNRFYEMMAEHENEIPKTSQITPFEFEDIYHRHAQSGTTDLILVLINSKGSATYDNAVAAIRLFEEDYSEYRGKMHIYCIDGMGYTALYGSPVVQAARMRKDGAPAEEIVRYLTEIMPRRQIYFGMYTLKYAAKSGRIPSAAAFLGDKLNLKPVMKIFDNEITTAAKCRGEHNLIATLADMSCTDMQPGQPYELIYGSDPVCRDELAEVMTQKLGYPPSDSYQIGAAIAANAGPKVAGVAFTRKQEG